MLQFGLRLGKRPRQLITTTPRPSALIKRLIGDPRSAITRAATQANAEYLSPAFLAEIVERYASTPLGRQEILGEIVEDRPDAARDDRGGTRARGAAATAHRDRRRRRPPRARVRTRAGS
jgi:phage terminase large subunit-like protein